MRQTVRFRPVYNGPACGDHERGIEIRVQGPSAGCADKRFLVPDPELPTAMAGLGRVFRVDVLRPNALGCGLVLDELLELTEGPECDHPIPMPIGNLGPGADSFEILHPDQGAARLERMGDDLLGYGVIDPGGVASFPSREPFQDALGALRTFGLETGADTPPFLAVFAEFATGFPVSAAGHGDISDPQVDPEDVLLEGVLNVAFDDDIGVNTIVGFDESRALGDVRRPQGLLLIGADSERGREALSRMGGERDDALLELQGKGPGIESHEGRTKLEASFEVGRFESSRGAAKGGHREVAREPEAAADLFVKRMMEPDGIGLAMISSVLSYLTAGSSVKTEQPR